MELLTLPLTHQQEILPEYEDVMGHTNVMWYTYMFDQATFSFFEKFGIDQNYFEQSSNGSFAVEHHIRYLAELQTGDNVSIFSRVLGRRNKTIHFMHFMRRDRDGQLAATNESVSLHIDLKQRRSTSLPPEITGVLDQIIEQHNQLEWEAPVCGVMKA